jgi:hypothetical protein
LRKGVFVSFFSYKTILILNETARKPTKVHE